MPRLRLFILWIVFVCVPLQGYAAAAMAFCGPGHAGGMSSAAHAMEAMEAGKAMQAVRVDQAGDDGHASHADHAAHAHHDDIVQGGAQVQAQSHADAGDAAQSLDTLHKCGTCGACHAVALTGVPVAAVLHDLPPADLAEPALAPATREPRVLDRPPRA